MGTTTTQLRRLTARVRHPRSAQLRIRRKPRQPPGLRLVQTYLHGYLSVCHTASDCEATQDFLFEKRELWLTSKAEVFSAFLPAGTAIRTAHSYISTSTLSQSRLMAETASLRQ